MRLFVWLLATLLAAGSSPAVDVVILRGDKLAAEAPGRAADVEIDAARIAEALDTLAVPHVTLSDAGLTAAALAGAPLVILPYNKLDDAQVAQLASYVTGGGRLLACFTTGSAALPKLLGVDLGSLTEPAYDGELARIGFDDAARKRWPGLPESIGQNSWHAFRLTPLPGTRVLGTWGAAPRELRPAITENAAGLYVGHVLMPGDLANKGLFLCALAAKGHLDLWLPALTAARAGAIDAVDQAATRWQKLQARSDLPDAKRAELLEAVTAAKMQAGALPPVGDGTAADVLLAMYRHLAADARQLADRLTASPPHELRGLWVFGSRPMDWPKICSQARNAGLNAIFYRVSRGGNAIYPSAMLPQDDWSTGRDEVKVAIETCRRYGLEFHAWRVCFHLGSAPADYVARLRKEGRISLDADGREAAFANPGDPRNRALEIDAMREIVERYDVDGLQLDYIRYTDDPHYDFDYGPVSRSEFEHARNAPVTGWPESVRFGALKEEYTRWMQRNIDQVVRDGARMIAEVNPRVCYSAAVWRRHQAYRYLIKQDWPTWLDEGWLDLLVPMDYVKDADELRDHVTQQVSLARGNTPVAAGIGAWLLDSPEKLVDQVEAARAAGAAGFVLFSSNAPDLDAQLAALKRGATSAPATPPTQAPPAHWKVPLAIERRDAPAALPAGSGTPVAVDFGPTLGTVGVELKAISGTIQVVRPETGEVLVEVGECVGMGGGRASFTGQFAPPEGQFQLRVAGRAEPAEGRSIDFWVDGPLLVGWTSEELEQYRAEQQPPAPSGQGVAVGVVAAGMKADELLTTLNASPGLQGVAVHLLTAEHIAPLKYLIVPQMLDPAPLHEGGTEALRDWVKAGGTLLLTHDAVGFRYHPTIFPELGWAGGRINDPTVKAAPQATLVPAGWTLTHSYGDHLSLRPTASAHVEIIDARSGAPVVVDGKFGEGRVILCGMLTGDAGGGTVMPDAERQLLLTLLGLPTGE